MRALVLLLALLASLTPAAGLPAREADARLLPCDALVDVPGQGPSCPAEGGWIVPLADGAFVFTHGPDPLPPLALPGLRSTYDLPAAPVACVTDPAEPHVRVLFTRPAISIPKRDAYLPSIYAAIEVTNGILLQSALAHGVDLRFRILCDALGNVLVDEVVLPTHPNDDHFGSIVSDVRAAGHTNPVAKYWILHDGAVSCGCGGQGSGWGDDRPGAENWNNGGNLHAVSYLGNYGAQGFATFWLSQVVLHEASHTMGAVQNSAPHTTGGFHCWDGADIMCYDDDGPDGHKFSVVTCRRVFAFETATTWPYDCNNDDYFHPRPPAGSYLASHWNVGGVNNRYLERVDLV